MITAALNTVTVSRYSSTERGDTSKLAALSSEIAARIVEMNELRLGSGTDLVTRLGNLANVDCNAFAIVIAVLHGDVTDLLDSYSVQGDRRHGSFKQTMHYRLLRELDAVQAIFPEAAQVLQTIRRSVQHHEDPLSQADVLRETRQ